MSTTRLPELPEPFAYPGGMIPHACVCGSWPGGECFRCELVNPYTADQMHAYGLAVWEAAIEAAAQAAATALDMKEEARAEAQTRTAKGMDDELRALRHYSTVSTYNAGVRRCVSAIRSLPDPSATPQDQGRER